MRSISFRTLVPRAAWVFGLISVFVSPQIVQAAVDPRTTAVVLIDMQYGFYRRGGAEGSVGLEQLVQRQIQLLSWAVSNRVPVLVFEYENYDQTDTRLMSVVNQTTHAVLEKDNDSGFIGKSSQAALDQLRQWGIQTLIVAGINGCCCVHDTAYGGVTNGFNVYTSADIVGDINYNPPTYPNNTWYFGHNHFTVFSSLEAILN